VIVQHVEFDRGADHVTFADRRLDFGAAVLDFWTHDGWLLFLVVRRPDDSEEGTVLMEIYRSDTLERAWQISPPDGWSFHRLTQYLGDRPSAVMSARDLSDPHIDWHWLIDPEEGSLERVNPAR
jgi:hypothetical protein